LQSGGGEEVGRSIPALSNMLATAFSYSKVKGNIQYP
jgi:hypothetical protein